MNAFNRGGNRQANSAIYRIMLVRMAHDDATRDYVVRRTAEGKTMGEIARMLKRYIAREIYKPCRQQSADSGPSREQGCLAGWPARTGSHPKFGVVYQLTCRPSMTRAALLW